MTKGQMVHELVWAWVVADNSSLCKDRFIYHDEVEAKLNRNWKKEGIELAFLKYVSGEWNIHRAMEWLDGTLCR